MGPLVRASFPVFIGMAMAVLVVLWLWRGREQVVSLDEKLWKADDLSGRPDAVTRRGRLYIPHEYKSTERDEPLEGHVVQVLCYCFLLEKAGYSVRFGMLHYGRSRHRISWNRRKRRDFLSLVQEARESLESDAPPCVLGRTSPRCARCSYRPLCHPPRE